MEKYLHKLCVKATKADKKKLISISWYHNYMGKLDAFEIHLIFINDYF